MHDIRFSDAHLLPYRGRDDDLVRYPLRRGGLEGVVGGHGTVVSKTGVEVCN